MKPAQLWQRNVLGAVVVVCALVVYVIIDFRADWSAYRNSVEPRVVIGKGESGSAGGQTWRLTSITHLNRSPTRFGPPLPAGTVLTVLDVDRSGTPDQGYCTAVITDGTTRWTAEGVGGYTPIPPEGVTRCATCPGPCNSRLCCPTTWCPRPWT